ncbi:MAG: hypothetical protein ABI467_12200 [Kofleriaceae bacterium]
MMLWVGCVGKAPPNGDNPDAGGGGGGDDAPGDGSGSAVTSQIVSGKVMDYFTGDALAATAIATDGLTPAAAATSGADGAYSLDVPVGSKLFAMTSRGSYRSTRSAVITVTDQPIAQDLYVASSADVARQFSSVNVTQTTGTIVAAEVQKNNGDPYAGLPLTAFTLVDSANAPVVGVSGPYFFGAVGDLDLAVTTSTAYGTTPRVRVAFLNVPAGTFTLNTAFLDGMGNPKINSTTIIVDAGGATLALNGGLSGGMAATAPITDPSFATDIYPRLQKAAKGGLGCANCHTANGPAAVLPYDGTPDVTLAAIKAAAGVLNLTTPAASLFLTYPLYEVTPPQNHPNATFLDVNDPNYKLFLLWITNGAKP